ncbi:hypothetical protein [Bradyrhizobium iriomotense]|uniref:Uncharacterized protein n=1 Tax=Bradyrhizobium iriomotense TaxID=441950 RepID=A0ABQ6ASF1_9BRAD|nr:hypothetical protein [Bradyrhizobium iriomotense]GLR85079.1 hypothetical protein GCM10007857_17890 [Bradyrhizobium iriomotense]
MLRTQSTTQVLARFGVRVGLLGCFAAFSNVGFVRGLAALFWMAIILCALVGLIKREPLFRARLNHWDEGVAFGALFALAHIVNQLNAA